MISIESGRAQSACPIGIFDSGLGGLTVQKEILSLLPNESTIYFGDNGRAPYGSKSRDTIIRYSLQIVRFLQQKSVKMIVIACNTASAFAYEKISATAGVPVIEVITPGAETAVAASQGKRIGVIGTKGTINSGVYEKALQKASGQPLKIISKACPLFVPLAEEGWWSHPATDLVANEYLAELKKSGIDTLVLGCTHYPLLQQAISRSMGPDVRLINSGEAVARSVREQLTRLNLANDSGETPQHEYYTSDSVEQFVDLGSAFLQQPIKKATTIAIERSQT